MFETCGNAPQGRRHYMSYFQFLVYLKYAFKKTSIKKCNYLEVVINFLLIY